jgi:hypothetical protein
LLFIRGATCVKSIIFLRGATRAVVVATPSGRQAALTIATLEGCHRCPLAQGGGVVAAQDVVKEAASGLRLRATSDVMEGVRRVLKRVEARHGRPGRRTLSPR